MALRYDLLVAQGEDYERTVPVNGTDSLAGWSVTGQVRDGTSPNAVLLHDLDVTFSGLNVVLRIPGSDSSDWDWRLARYDVELRSPTPGLVPTRFLHGAVIVDAETTR
jgi:hypothetical protein